MMEEINRDNYEIYALDYLEGTLSDELCVAFNAFLALNSDIAEELHGCDEAALDPKQASAMSFDNAQIKINVTATAHISEHDYESWFAQAADGSLNRQMQVELQEFLDENPALMNDFLQYGRTILKPDLNVEMPAAAHLKHAIPLWENARFFGMRIAAGLILAIGGYSILNMVGSAELYVPRNADASFAGLEIDAHQPQITLQTAIKNKTLNTSAANTRAQTYAYNSSHNELPAENAEPEKRLQQIELMEVSLLVASSPEAQPEARQVENANPQVMAWVEDNEPKVEKSGRLLSVPAFIGKTFFGLDPENSETARDLIKASLLKTINSADDVELMADAGDSDKSIFGIAAGNFEFKRVSYK